MREIHTRPTCSASCSLQILFQCFPRSPTCRCCHLHFTHEKGKGETREPPPTPWINHLARELQGSKTTAVDDEGLARPLPTTAQSQDTLQKGREVAQRGKRRKEGREGLETSLSHGLCQALQGLLRMKGFCS